MGISRNPLGSAVGQIVGAQLRAQPVVDEVRRKYQAWRDPRARALRARKRSVRATTAWSGVTVLGGGGAAVDFATAASPGLTAYAFAAFGVLTGVAAVSSGVQTRKLYKMPLPRAARVRLSLPPQGSAAREPMRRLDVAEQTVDELLAQLRRPVHGSTTVPAESIESAADAADEASTNLRTLAAQLQAVERSRSVAPAAERDELRQPIVELEARLAEGVTEYGKLAVAAGRAVAAGATRPEVTASSQVATGGASNALAEATEELSGLAYGLRELSAHYPH
jgi:hypothetical protein